VAAVWRIRQWFLTLRGDSGVFRLSADGLPAETTVVPAQWVPGAGPGSSVAVNLLYFQAASRTGAAGDYVVSMTLNVTVGWTVLLEGN
jgi:hypothetical protein